MAYRNKVNFLLTVHLWVICGSGLCIFPLGFRLKKQSQSKTGYASGRETRDVLEVFAWMCRMSLLFLFHLRKGVVSSSPVSM